MVEPGKLANSCVIGLGLALVLGGNLAAIAQTLPDDEVFEYLNGKYSLLIKTTRGACGYYIDPRDVYQVGQARVLTVKMIRGPEGTACKNTLNFLQLKVNCRTNETAYFSWIGAPNFWRSERSIDPTVAKTICTLPNPRTLPASPARS